MSLSKALTKATPLSKITAAIILIGLVLIGFAFGVIYAQTADFANNQSYSSSPIACKPTPTPE